MEEGKGAPMTKRNAPPLLSATAALAAIILFGPSALAGEAASAAGPLRTESGRLQDLIARLASSDYVLNERAVDNRPYVDPAPVLNAFRHVAAALAWGDPREAASQAAKLDYEVVKFTDRVTKDRYLVLRQNLDRAPDCFGWGSYIINPHSHTDALVEVPHPIADAQTPELGGAIFEKAVAKGFLLAGAHRDKADVPDLIDSVFHQVHTAWIGPAAQVAAWQIHGFAKYKHSFPRDARVIASTGDGDVAPELNNLDAQFDERGLTSYVYNDRPAKSRANRRLNGDVPGVAFTGLAAAGNEQGRHSRSLGGTFVHVELESGVRFAPDQREKAVEAITAAMSEAPAQSSDDEASTATLASHETEVSKEPATAAIDEAPTAEPVERVATLPEAAGAPAQAGDPRKLP
jgi:hypothetical protein